jgi:ABC-type multidrug transport system fused ATPase/permease subunit
MERGRIVEEGSHRDLLDRDGIYARLHALQVEESPA